MALTEDVIQIVFYLTVFIVAVKAVMLVYIEAKIRKRKAEGNELSVAFMRGTWVMILSLLLSRLCYMYFDFVVTRFDQTVYHVGDNEWTWKAGMLIVGLGMAYIVWVVDRKILSFKFKGIFSYIIIAGAIFQVLYPIETEGDFGFVSTVGILPNLGMLVIFVVFINIAIKTSGAVRRTATVLIFAMLFIAVAALLVNAGLITALDGALGLVPPASVDVYMYITQSIMKTVGITMLAVGASRWG